MRITVIPSDGVRAEIALENDELGNAPYVRCGPDGTVALEFGDDIDRSEGNIQREREASAMSRSVTFCPLARFRSRIPATVTSISLTTTTGDMNSPIIPQSGMSSPSLDYGRRVRRCRVALN